MLPAPVIAAAAWAVPGLGHLLAGRPAKALYMGGLILGAFAAGLLLGQGHSVSSEKFPFHWYGQLGAGGPALLADALLGAVPQRETILRLELGVVFTTVAGILNVVALVDAYTIARQQPGAGRPTERG
jgi:hypothetical protein